MSQAGPIFQGLMRGTKWSLFPLSFLLLEVGLSSFLDVRSCHHSPIFSPLLMQFTRTFSYKQSPPTPTHLLPTRYQHIFDNLQSRGTLLAKCPKQLFETTPLVAGSSPVHEQNKRLKEEATLKAVQLSKVKEMAEFLLGQNDRLREQLTNVLNQQRALFETHAHRACNEESRRIMENVLQVQEENKVLKRHLEEFKKFGREFNETEESIGQEVRQKQEEKEALKKQLQACLDRQFLIAERLALCQARHADTIFKHEQVQSKLTPKQIQNDSRKLELERARRQSNQLKQNLLQCEHKINMSVNSTRSQLFTLSEKCMKLQHEHNDLLARMAQEDLEIERLKALEKMASQKMLEFSEDLKANSSQVSAKQRKAQVINREREELQDMLIQGRNEAQWLKKETLERVRELQRQKGRLNIQNIQRKKKADRLIQEMQHRMRKAIQHQ